MAFKDIDRLLYPDAEGRATIKLAYRDGNHRYYAYPRVDFERDVNDKKAWGKNLFPTGTTTLLESVLEKKGLMKYAMTKALDHLFGFYDFTGDNGDRMTGYRQVKGKLAEGQSPHIGTLWDSEGRLKPLSKEEALEVILDGSKASDRHKQNAADIGTVVHDAIEHYVKANPHELVEVLDKDGKGTGKFEVPAPVPSGFDIAEQYTWNIKNTDFETEKDETLAWENFDNDVAQAKVAFQCFKTWWDKEIPLLFGAEDILYSKELNTSGTYDGDIGIRREFHPVYGNDAAPNEKFAMPSEVIAKIQEKDLIRCTTDWKTSKASKSEQAAAPRGIYYSYFFQNAIYEIMRREMGFPANDDLLGVSVRKDGGFDLVFASELGFTVDECVEAAMMVIKLHRFITRMKKALVETGPEPPVKKERKPKKAKMVEGEF